MSYSFHDCVTKVWGLCSHSSDVCMLVFFFEGDVRAKMKWGDVTTHNLGFFLFFLSFIKVDFLFKIVSWVPTNLFQLYHCLIISFIFFVCFFAPLFDSLCASPITLWIFFCAKLLGFACVFLFLRSAFIYVLVSLFTFFVFVVTALFFFFGFAFYVVSSCLFFIFYFIKRALNGPVSFIIIGFHI